MDRWLEQCEAFYAALRQLDAEYPPQTDSQVIDRNMMHWYMATRAYPSVRLFAIASGIPEERLAAIDALIF